VETMAIKMAFLPQNESLARGYAAKEQNNRFKTTVSMATKKLLYKYCPNGKESQTRRKLSRVGCRGKSFGGVSKRFSVGDFKAVLISHSKGKRVKRAIASNRAYTPKIWM